MPSPPARTRPETWTMAVTHQAFRREFEIAPRIVRDLGPGEEERYAAATRWFALMLGMMHHHHEAEDSLMYPLLVDHAPAPLLDRMEAQHHRLAEAVDVVVARLEGWRLDRPETGESLALAFDALLPVLVEHVDAEEQEVMPIVAAHLTGEEYERHGRSGNQADPQTLMMAFGSVIEQSTDHEAAVMLEHPPSQVRDAWYSRGAQEHRTLMSLLRGSLQPIGRSTPSSTTTRSSA